MITLRRADERGHANHGWLDSHHTFSFAGYHDPAHMGFRALRVINDDRIAPTRGFGAHAHRDMEIVTYVLEGKLRHKDSMGQERVFGPNTIQAMSAGTGVVHSEFNPSSTEWVHLLQIWIVPSADDFEPSYQQIEFAPKEKMGKLRLIAAPVKDPAQPAAVINQDATVYATFLEPEQKIEYSLKPGRHAWVQVAEGDVVVNGEKLTTGDAVAISDESAVSLAGSGTTGVELLLFDLA